MVKNIGSLCSNLFVTLLSYFPYFTRNLLYLLNADYKHILSNYEILKLHTWQKYFVGISSKTVIYHGILVFTETE